MTSMLDNQLMTLEASEQTSFLIDRLKYGKSFKPLKKYQSLPSNSEEQLPYGTWDNITQIGDI